MTLGDRLPPFEGVEWLDGVKLDLPPDRPLLVHFWSSGCPLCHEGAQDVAGWHAKHGSDALDVVAVYAMRPDASEVDVDAVRRDARSVMRIEWPCAIDRDRSLERAFACPYAPGYFIFDAAGVLRHRQMGNDALERVGALIDRLTVKASPGRGA